MQFKLVLHNFVIFQCIARDITVTTSSEFPYLQLYSVISEVLLPTPLSVKFFVFGEGFKFVSDYAAPTGVLFYPSSKGPLHPKGLRTP